MFDAFWREGELALMFGAAAVGKSLLAVQLGDALARGRPLADGFEMPRSRRKVLYVDLRHSDRQFAERYSYRVPVRRLGSILKPCKFAENLYRSRPPANDHLCEWLSQQIAEHRFDAVIVDDLTALKKTHDGVREMLAAMRGLKRLCDELRVSVLAIAGSEEPASARGLSERDLKRASVICDVADTVFAIGRGRGDGRSIIQTRSRNAPLIWTEHNAPSAQIGQTANGGPGLVFDERFAATVDPQTRDEICRIRAMRQAGRTWRVIEAELGIPKTRAVRLFKKWTPELGEGEVKAEGERRKAELGSRNAECGTRSAEREEQEDMGLAEAIDASLSSTRPDVGAMATKIPHSALRVPHSDRIPHSEVRTPHLKYGPERVALRDLKPGFDRAGEEIFIESEEEHTLKPMVWYKRDRRGNTSRFVRNGSGSAVTRMGRAAFL
jgi:hypothetical protein